MQLVHCAAQALLILRCHLLRLHMLQLMLEIAQFFFDLGLALLRQRLALLHQRLLCLECKTLRLVVQLHIFLLLAILIFIHSRILHRALNICLGQIRAGADRHMLLSAGAKGKRYCLPNSMVLIHQPSGGAQGQQTEIQIVADFMRKTRDRLNNILASNTGQPLEVIERDTERDNYMTAEEAMAYGLVDKVIVDRTTLSDSNSEA